MWQSLRKDGLIDRLAIGMSGLCVVHCIGTSVLVAFLAAGGSVFLSPAFHEVGLVVALVLAVFGLGRGIWIHGYMLPACVGGLGIGTMAGSLMLPHGQTEMLISIVGVLLVALGHDLNRRAVI